MLRQQYLISVQNLESFSSSSELWLFCLSALQTGWLILRRTTSFRKMGRRVTGKMIQQKASRISSMQLKENMSWSMTSFDNLLFISIQVTIFWKFIMTYYVTIQVRVCMACDYWILGWSQARCCWNGALWIEDAAPCVISRSSEKRTLWCFEQYNN